MLYSQDLRQRVIKFAKEGHSLRETAARFSVNHQTVSNWLRQPVARKCGPKSPHKLDMQALAQHVASHPDAYLSERASHFGMSVSGMWYALKRLGISKKNVHVRGK